MGRKKKEKPLEIAVYEPETVPEGLTHEEKQTLCDLIQTKNLDVGSACASVGLTRRELKRICRDDPEFAEMFDEAIQNVMDKIVGVAVGQAMNGTMDMIKFMLQSHRREQYGQRSKVDIKVEDVTKLDDESLVRMIEQCQEKMKS